MSASQARGALSSDMLGEAARIVAGDRNTTHGDMEASFAALAGMWNAYLSARKISGPINAVDAAQMMVLLKMVRTVQGKAVRDHFVDQCGYAAIAGEIVLSGSNA